MAQRVQRRRGRHWRMPAGAVLHGGGEFLLSADGALLREQIAPYLETNPARVAELVGTTRPIVDYAEECLLLARFGLYTWGHWLGELLPKAVLVGGWRFGSVINRRCTSSDLCMPPIGAALLGASGTRRVGGLKTRPSP